MSKIEIMCKGCKRKPSEIMEYKLLYRQCGCKTPEEVVMKEEGTYNKETGLFWCTSCYIKAGMPLGKA